MSDDTPASPVDPARHDSSDPAGEAAAVHAALTAALASVGDAFEPDELAFLAATSKVELPIRDRLAWAIHRALEDRFHVAREWRRADLAVLDGDRLVAQLEAKALYSFNVLQPTNCRAYLDRLTADAAKMSALAELSGAPGASQFVLSMLIDVRGDIPPELRRHVVKYASGIRAGIKANTDGVRSVANDKWRQELHKAFEATTLEVSVDAGRVWDLDVTVDLYLSGPLPRPQADLLR
jgi:hypothetical protein